MCLILVYYLRGQWDSDAPLVEKKLLFVPHGKTCRKWIRCYFPGMQISGILGLLFARQHLFDSSSPNTVFPLLNAWASVNFRVLNTQHLLEAGVWLNTRFPFNPRCINVWSPSVHGVWERKRSKGHLAYKSTVLGCLRLVHWVFCSYKNPFVSCSPANVISAGTSSRFLLVCLELSCNCLHVYLEKFSTTWSYFALA